VHGIPVELVKLIRSPRAAGCGNHSHLHPELKPQCEVAFPDSCGHGELSLPRQGMRESFEGDAYRKDARWKSRMKTQKAKPPPA